MTSYSYDYPRPAVTADIVIFSIENGVAEVLLIQRANEPFKDQWAFPGGFLDMDETIETCAKRELKEETCLSEIELFEVGCFSEINRDPRGRTVSIAFYGIVQKSAAAPKAQDDAKSLRWFAIDSLPPLAFDHQHIFDKAYALLKKEQNF